MIAARGSEGPGQQLQVSQQYSPHASIASASPISQKIRDLTLITAHIYNIIERTEVKYACQIFLYPEIE